MDSNPNSPPLLHHTDKLEHARRIDRMKWTKPWSPLDFCMLEGLKRLDMYYPKLEKSDIIMIEKKILPNHF